MFRVYDVTVRKTHPYIPSMYIIKIKIIRKQTPKRSELHSILDDDERNEKKTVLLVFFLHLVVVVVIFVLLEQTPARVG